MRLQQKDYPTIFRVALSCLCFFTPLPARAEIDYLEMNGIHSLVDPQYESWSPIHGFTYFKSDLLRNLRFYGNYGKKNEKFPCFEWASQAHNKFVSRNDCPQDHTAALIQHLFPSQDGVTLTPNQIPLDPVSHLTPRTIGKILNWISQLKYPLPAENSQQKKQLVQSLTELIFQDIDPVEFHNHLQNQKKRLTQERNKLQFKLEKCQVPQKAQALEQQIQSLQSDLMRIGNLIDELPSKQSPLMEIDQTGLGRKWKETDFRTIVNSILGALSESKNQPNRYSTDNVKHDLLAFAWAIARDKKDFIDLLEPQAQILSSHGKSVIADAHKNSHFNNSFLNFMSQTYKLDEYKQWIKNLKNKKISNPTKELIQDPERTAFLAYSERTLGRTIPPIVTHGRSGYFDAATKRNIIYLNCGDNSLRNFFNAVIFNPEKQKLDCEILEKLSKKPGIQVKKSLIDFYKNHSELSKIPEAATANEWGQQVTSLLTGVQYELPGNNPACSISAGETGMENMLSAFKALLFEDDGLFDKKSTPEKWDQICSALSRDGWKLKWKKRNLDPSKYSTPITFIDFIINDQPAFSFGFTPVHFQIEDLSQAMSSVLEENHLNLSPLLQHSLTAPWYANPKSIDKVTDLKASPVEIQDLIFSSSLRTSDEKVSFVQEAISKLPKEQAIQLTKKILEKLSYDDYYAHTKIYNSLKIKFSPPPPEELLPIPMIQNVASFNVIEMAQYPSFFRDSNVTPLQKLQKLKTQGAPMNGKQLKGATELDPGKAWNLLHAAAYYKQWEILKYLISENNEHPEVFSEKNDSGRLFMELVRPEKRIEILDSLHKSVKISPDVLPRGLFKSWMDGIHWDQIKILIHLLHDYPEYLAQPVVESTYRAFETYFLNRAIENNQLDIAKELFQALKHLPQALATTDYDFKTPLMRAIEGKHEDLALSLIKALEDHPDLVFMDSDQHSILSMAISNAQFKILLELIEVLNKHPDQISKQFSLTGENGKGLIDEAKEKGIPQNLLKALEQLATSKKKEGPPGVFK